MKTNTPRRSFRFALFAAFASLALLAPVPTRAVLLYWDTTPGTAGFGTASGAWGSDSFWNTSNTGATPGSFRLNSDSADDVFFNSAGGGNIDVGTVSASSITFGTSQAITLNSGGTITLGGAGVNSGIFVTANTAASVINSAIVLNPAVSVFTIANTGTSSGTLTLGGTLTGGAGANQILSLRTSSGATTISGAIANGSGGTVGLTVEGANGIITLTGLNTYTGATTLRRGTLNLDFSAQANDASNLIASSSPLVFSGSGGRLLLTGKTDGGTNSQTFDSITYTSGAIAIASVSSGSGTVNFDAGTVTRANNLTLDLSKPTSGEIAIGNSLTNGIIGPWATFGGYTDYATVTGGNVAGLANSTNTTQAGWTVATDNYTLSSTGNQSLAGNRMANTLRYTGTNTANIQLNGNEFQSNGILNAGTNTLTISGTGASALVIGASNELVLQGRSAITVSAPVKSTAADQTITLGNNSSVSTALVSLTGGLNTTAAGVTIVANGNNANVLSGALAGTASKITLTGPGSLTVGGLSGDTNHSIEVNSTTGGVFSFNSSAKTFTGGFTLTAGTVLQTGTNAPSLGAGALTFAGGTFAIPTNDTSTLYTNTLNITGPVTFGTPGLNALVGFSGASQSISNSPTITVEASTNSRGVRFITNPMQLNSNAAFVGTGNMPLVQFSGGFDLRGDNRTLIYNNTTTNTIGGDLIDSVGTGRSLTLAGSGVVTINTMSAFNNGTRLIIDGVSARPGGQTVLPDFITINSGELDVRTNFDVAGISGSGGNVVNSDGSNRVLTLTGSGNYVYDGNIAPITTSRIVLVKNGVGTQTLNGVNTYTGNTTINEGTLIINGSLANTAVSVAAGATLGGSGTIGGATTISGSLSPGNSIGTLNVTSNVTWAGAASSGSGTDWRFELGAGNTSDLLNITGQFLKNTGVGSNFRFDFAGSTAVGTFTLVDWSSNTSLGGGTSGTSFYPFGFHLDQPRRRQHG